MPKSQEEVNKILTETRKNFSQGEESLLSSLLKLDYWKLTLAAASALCVVLLVTLIGYAGKKPYNVELTKRPENSYTRPEIRTLPERKEPETVAKKVLSANEEERIEAVIASLNSKKITKENREIYGECALNCLDGRYKYLPSFSCSCDTGNDKMSPTLCCRDEAKWAPNEVFLHLR